MELNTNYYTGSYVVTGDMKKGDNLKVLAENAILTPNEMIDMSCFMFGVKNDPLSVAHFLKVERAGDDCVITDHQNARPKINNYSLGILENWTYTSDQQGASEWRYTNTLSQPRIGYEATTVQIPTIAPVVECASKYIVLAIRVHYVNVTSKTTHRDGYNIYNTTGGNTVNFTDFNEGELRNKLANGEIIIDKIFALTYYGNSTSRSQVTGLTVFPSYNGTKIQCTIGDEYTDDLNIVERACLLPQSLFASANAGGYPACLMQGGNGVLASPSQALYNTVVYIPRANPYFWKFGYRSNTSTGANVFAYIDNIRDLTLAYNAYYATGFNVCGNVSTARTGVIGDTLPDGIRRANVNDVGELDPDNPTDVTTGLTDDPTKMHSGTGWNGNEDIDPNDYATETPIVPPAISTVNSFNRTYAMTYNNIRALADELWNADDTIFEEIVQGLALLGECPMQGLIDLRLYPFNVSTVVGSGTIESIRVGRTTLTATGVKMANDVNAVIDLGSCTFFKNFRSFLDYAPYTEARLYIPYCGIVPVDTSEFMGHTITAKMVVDVVTGACEAFVYADDIIIIHANGDIGVSIPMTGDNAAAYAAGVLGNIVGGSVDVVSGVASGSIVKTLGGVADVTGGMLGATPTQYAKSGVASSACSMWLPQYCYFIIDRPKPLAPNGYGHSVGFACEEYGKISSYSGFTVCDNVDTTGISGTDEEKKIIKEIMESGFYV